jgi:serine/threonine protein kinase
MVLLDRVILDEVTGSKVVGFTTRFVSGGTLDKSRPRFKLKWLRQLMSAVDDLNLRHGIVHQDIAHRNLLIDSDTDSIVIIDFNFVYRVGTKKKDGRNSEGPWSQGQRDDVKGVLIFLYEYITRDPALTKYFLHLLEEKDFMDPAKWIKYPDVELDEEVYKFYLEVMTGVQRRRAAEPIKHYTEAPEPLEWPSVPERAEKLRFPLRDRREAGLPYLEWKLPAASALDPSRRMLATGRYADEEEAFQKAQGAGTAGDSESSGGSATASKTAAAKASQSHSPGRRCTGKAKRGSEEAPPAAAAVEAGGTHGGVFRPSRSPKRKRSGGELALSDEAGTTADAHPPAKRILRRSLSCGPGGLT